MTDEEYKLLRRYAEEDGIYLPSDPVPFAVPLAQLTYYVQSRLRSLGDVVRKLNSAYHTDCADARRGLLRVLEDRRLALQAAEEQARLAAEMAAKEREATLPMVARLGQLLAPERVADLRIRDLVKVAEGLGRSPRALVFDALPGADVDGFPDRLKEARQRLGLTQTDVYDLSEHRCNHAEARSNGALNPKVSVIRAWALALECSPGWLAYGGAP